MPVTLALVLPPTPSALPAYEISDLRKRGRVHPRIMELWTLEGANGSARHPAMITVLDAAYHIYESPKRLSLSLRLFTVEYRATFSRRGQIHSLCNLDPSFHSDIYHFLFQISLISFYLLLFYKFIKFLFFSTKLTAAILSAVISTDPTNRIRFFIVTVKDRRKCEWS